MSSQKLNSLTIAEHDDLDGIPAKKVLNYGFDPVSNTKRRLAVDEDGKLKVDMSIEGETAVLANEATITQGTVRAGTYQSTFNLNSVYHQIGETAGGIDLYYDFNVATGGNAEKVKFHGRYQGGQSHWIDTYAYNWTTEEWDKLNTQEQRINQQNSDYDREYVLTEQHTDQSTKTTRIRFLHNDIAYNTNHNLYVDYLAVVSTTSDIYGLKNLSNAQINPAIEEKQNPLAGYMLSEKPSPSDVGDKYFGYEKANGDWYIKKMTDTSVRFTKGTGGISSAWADRETLTYSYFSEVF
jgi:hypothetical protein